MGNVAEDWQMAMIRFIIGFGDRLDGRFKKIIFTEW